MKFEDFAILAVFLQISRGTPMSPRTQLIGLVNNNLIQNENSPNTTEQAKFHIQYAPLPLQNSIQYTTEIFAANIDFSEHNETITHPPTQQSTETEVLNVEEQEKVKTGDNYEVWRVPSTTVVRADRTINSRGIVVTSKSKNYTVPQASKTFVFYKK